MTSTALGPLREHVIGQPTKRRRKKRRRPDLEEAREQKAFVKWARARGLMLNHQNNGASTKARRIHLHQMGCTAGAADVLIFDNMVDSRIRGLALEFKADGAVQSPAQRDWQIDIDRHGWVYRVVYSAEEAQTTCLGLGL